MQTSLGDQPNSIFPTRPNLPMGSMVLRSTDPIESFVRVGGGKATHLARLSQNGFPVPRWICMTSTAFDAFVSANHLDELLAGFSGKNLKEFSARVEATFLASPLPVGMDSALWEALESEGLSRDLLAVRSSGLDEDSAENSFAGQFSSFLFQRGRDQVIESLKRCWASGFSERALSYRIERGLPLKGIRVGVVVQKMVNAECAGVVFSRNPIRPLDREKLIISSVWGLGEGLVSGELDADHFEVHRQTFEVHSTVVPKPVALLRKPEGGLFRKEVPADLALEPSLSAAQIRKIAEISLLLESRLGCPQDSEWAIEEGAIYLVQTRPITHIPKDAFFDSKVNGDASILWDNSNIIESYSGVTSPLTFSFASLAYRQVYVQFCELVGVPTESITRNEPMFRNMLGLVRGRIYYNLVNWYKLVLLLPGASSNKGFMETMMGVKQKLKPEMAQVFDEVAEPPHYSFWKKLSVHSMTFWRFFRINSIIGEFRSHFDAVYEKTRKLPFGSMSLTDLAKVYQELDEQILRRWQAPIINDYLCMVFFGILKKLTENWIEKGDAPGSFGASLQNDLLCGQGELESTEPTKWLMRMAEKVDTGNAEFRSWLLATPTDVVWEAFREASQSAGGRSTRGPVHLAPDVVLMFHEFLDRYGFRCINELKLEEQDLHDNPNFALSAIASYVRMKSYSIQAMEKREAEIRDKAEALVREKLRGGWVRRPIYFWILKQTRKAVRNRENLRFARTKIFGVARHVFRGMGEALTRLGFLAQSQDIFYLTCEEVMSFIEGRSVSLQLGALVEIRRAEYAKYRKDIPPPDRLITRGAAGASFVHAQILLDSDLLRGEAPLSTDPDVLVGTPCCPGVVEGLVRVVENVQDAEGIQGEILVTARTDPGWVPLYPSCSGLLIERGSLLSHSAVVARELGLPTIVGISGGLMSRLKTGQKVRVDAGKGEVRILA